MSTNISRESTSASTSNPVHISSELKDIPKEKSAKSDETDNIERPSTSSEINEPDIGVRESEVLSE